MLAVGGHGDDSNATGIDGDAANTQATESGAVHVFSRSMGQWTQQAYIKASNTNSFDRFGYKVDLSADGNTLAVSALTEDSASDGINGNQNDNNAGNSGAAYVFTQANNVWSQQAYVKASNSNGDDEFGNALALSSDGNTLVVGARAECSIATGINGDQGSNGANNAGAAYVFLRTDGNWAQQAYLKASNTEPFDLFGSDVAISGDGDTIVVTAVQEDSGATGIDGGQTDNSAQASGAAYVFTRSNDAWSQQAYVKASNTGEFDNFGFAAALSGNGNMLVVGAVSEDSAAAGLAGSEGNTTDNSGAAYLFVRENDEWLQRTYIKAPNTEQTPYSGVFDLSGDLFGNEIALSSDGATLVIGGYNEASSATGLSGDQNDNSADNAGAVYVY